MIDYVRGILAFKGASSATVEAGGVGYAIEIPLSTFEKLPGVGEEVKVLTHHHVREDTQKLYGFFTEGERDVFRLLIGITKIGPKVALSVLSRVSAGELVDAVARNDIARLKGVPGIGKKTAERLILELRGKLKGMGLGEGLPESAGGSAVPGTIREETQEALTALGYKEDQVSRALTRVAEVVEPTAPLEEWIRKALQVM